MLTTRTRGLKTVIIAGLIAGLLDITAACIKFYSDTGQGPEPVLRFVASGIFGTAAFSGATAMIVWGLFFHFFIALGWASIYYLLSKAVNVLISSPWISGLIYGLIVWLMMNLVVVPASETPRLPFTWENALINMGILVLCVGWPIALVVAARARKVAGF